MNIPNILTIIRFLIVPIFGIYLFSKNYVVAAALFTAAGITDVLDGYIARKYKLVTNFGKIADPLADKLMQLTALVILSCLGKIPIFILIIIIAKELLIGIGSISLYKNKNYVVSANWYGKMSSVIFYFAIIALIIFDPKNIFANILVWIAVVSALFAFFMYTRNYRQTIEKLKNDHK